MIRSPKLSRAVRWLLVVSASGLLPAFVLRCDKAALNFQRGLAEGLGLSLSDVLVEQALTAYQPAENDQQE